MLRPWAAEDGGLVRLRLIGGELGLEQLAALAAVSAKYGDGNLHLTGRANLQLRGLPLTDDTVTDDTLSDDTLSDEVIDALLGTGLVPHPGHELVRNVMVSPLSGISGGLADLRPLGREYDELVCADPRMAALPGRFLVVLDDGRGDIQGRTLDLGAMAVDEGQVQVRAGSYWWGEVLALDAAPVALVELAHAFLDARGEGATAAWQVDELVEPLLTGARDPRTLRNSGPLPYGPFAGGEHVEVPGGVLTPALVEELLAIGSDPLVVTGWNGIVVTA